MSKHFANFVGQNSGIFGDANNKGVWALADHFYKRVRDNWQKDDADIVITMWGGGGGGRQFPGGSPTWGTPSPGGAGGSLIFTGRYSDLGAVSGDTLYLYVGGGGSGPSPGAGGPNGGHPGGGGPNGPGNAQGGGGGMSSVYLNGPHASGTRLFIAGGGAGGEYTHIAGYPAGWPPPPSGNSAGGGTQTAGGKAGTPTSYPNGNAGSQFTGGQGAQAGNSKSAGGGAGWYGGGGGGADTGAANGQPGGGGSNYHNPTISSPLVVHANFFNDPNFNPGAPMGYPVPTTPYFGPRYSASPAYPGTRITLPGQNSGNPLYSLPYCGGSTVAGGGYPGSIHITVGGTTTSFTSVGPHTFTLP